MPLKVVKACKICQRCLKDPQFMKLLFTSREYVPGGPSVRSIADQQGCEYKALLRHCKKHQAISPSDLANRQAAEVHRQAKNEIVKRALAAGDVRQKATDALAAALEQYGDIQIGKDITLKDAIALALKASKDADDVAAKKKDQEIDVFKLMTGARSGAPVLPAEEIEDKPFDPWEEGEIVG